MEFTISLSKWKTLLKQAIQEIVSATYDEGGKFSEDESM